MAKVLSVPEIEAILVSGRFDEFLGAVEDEHLDCKGGPYQLDQDRQKMELAKDVSALANADGGFLLIGPHTEKDPAHLGDEVRRVNCFAANLVDTDQYRKVTGAWMYPSVQGVTVKWWPDATNPAEGIVSIFVPREATRDRPFLVGRVVEETGKVLGSWVGYFERIQSGVKPMSVGEVRERLKDGFRFSELDARLRGVEETLGKLVAPPPRQEPAVPPDMLVRRLGAARAAVGLQERPTMLLVARAQQPVEFPALFESRGTDVVQLLENPPRLRNAGFDLNTRRPSEIIQGELRRTTSAGNKLLELWRDGVLIFIAPGDEWHLCWGMKSDATTGLRINNLALAETTFLFSQLAVKLFEHAVPQPEKVTFSLELAGMTILGKPCSLNPYRPDPYGLWLDEQRRYAPADGRRVAVESERVGADPGVVSYRLLAELYAWFGFEAVEMPYVDRATTPPSIDPNQLR